MKILFMCVANSARSQIAEALARATLGPAAEVRSAGSRPTGKVHEFALQVLREVGVPVAGLYSKAVDELEPAYVERLDFLITLCSDEVCPTLKGHFERLSWAMPDPAAAPESGRLASFRQTRESIAAKLREFAARMS